MAPNKSLEAIQKQLQTYTTPSPSTPKGAVLELLNEGKAIYGVDSREETVRSQAPGEIARAVCVLFESDKLRATPGGHRLLTREFGLAYTLCPGQPFADQPLLGYGSGFLVAPDIVATAGHCVEGRDITETIFMFDYTYEEGAIRDVRSQDSIYFGEEVLHCVLEPNGADYALVRLDRRVEGIQPLTVHAERPLKGEGVYIVGHPVGLPKKYAGDAIVTDASPETYFVTNLDAFGGNSGSPVFDTSHRVRGILVRGENDFIYAGDCRIMATFPLYKGGEHVCHASTWSQLVPTTRGNRTVDSSNDVRETSPSRSTPPNAAPSGPSEESPEMIRGRELLENYLLSAYSVSELRRLLVLSPQAANLVRRVNFQQSPVDVVTDVVGVMLSEKTIDRPFFTLLRKDRPRRAAEIDEAASYFEPRPETSPHRSPPPVSSSPETKRVPTNETRREVRNALLSLAPNEFEDLVEYEIEETARMEVRGLDRLRSQALALVNYYDVPHRGLAQLIELIKKSRS